jgi:hypothetical protein
MKKRLGFEFGELSAFSGKAQRSQFNELPFIQASFVVRRDWLM